MIEAIRGPWTMPEPHLRALLETAGRRLDGDLDLSGLGETAPEALSTATGSRVEGTRRAFVRDGVAVLPVTGPLFRRSGLLSRLVGGTSLERLARYFSTAVESPQVEAVLLDVDSPGGSVNGVSEASDLIYGAREELPVVAFVSGAAASGAYWLASAAETVVAADTALLGSIGVRMVTTDTSERDRQRGVRRVEVVSSQSPRKAPDPTTEEGRDQVQETVDELASVMIEDIARNRSVSAETVREDFGGGRLLVGENAVEAGLADGLSTFENLLTGVAEAPRAPVEASTRIRAEEDSVTTTTEEPPETTDPEPTEAKKIRAAAERAGVATFGAGTVEEPPEPPSGDVSAPEPAADEVEATVAAARRAGVVGDGRTVGEATSGHSPTNSEEIGGDNMSSESLEEEVAKFREAAERAGVGVRER